MIEVYKTNVQTKVQSKRVLKLLKHSFATARINFDLQDRDKILRVEGIRHADTTKVLHDVVRLGFTCEILN